MTKIKGDVGTTNYWYINVRFSDGINIKHVRTIGPFPTKHNAEEWWDLETNGNSFYGYIFFQSSDNLPALSPALFHVNGDRRRDTGERSAGNTVASVSVSEDDPSEGQHFIVVVRNYGMWLMGPFKDEDEAMEWGRNTLRVNPGDDPRWHTVIPPRGAYNTLYNKMVTVDIYDPEVFDMNLNKLSEPPPNKGTDKGTDKGTPRVSDDTYDALDSGYKYGLNVARGMAEFCQNHDLSTSVLSQMLEEKLAQARQEPG